jgi:hypothetical protein
MKKANNIVEEFIKLSDRDDISKMLRVSTAYYDDNREIHEDFPYCYVVYAGSGSTAKLISSHLSKEYDASIQNKFAEIIESQQPQTFNDCVYITTIFDPFAIYTSSQNRNPFERITSSNSIIDSILEESLGNLVYHHQVEILYRMHNGCTPEKAQIFRKELWKRKDWAIAESDIIQMYDGSTLSEILQKRLLFDFTFFPSYLGGMNLFLCFNKDGFKAQIKE